MVRKEYRICASDTPSTLAGEVTELLAQGWELYGHPFVGAQNGHEAGPPICQAMVRGNGQAVAMSAAAGAETAVRPVPAAARPAVKPKPQVSKRQAPARPKRPYVAATAKGAAIFLGVAFAGAFLGDALMFRTGVYAQYLEPVSSTGTFERVFYHEANRRPSGKKEVLVLGNSRIAEGFSAKIANEYKSDGYWFENCAVPATAGRDFYYFVRDIDPQRNRYAAITIPIDDYNDIDWLDDPADRMGEMWMVINRLRMTDILPYTFSFDTWAARSIVIRGATFKGLVYQRDLQDFMEHYKDRLARVKFFREHSADWSYAYGGSAASLAGMQVDWAGHRVTFPAGMPADQQSGLTKDIFREPPQHGWTRTFQTKWLGALTDLYRGSKTRIIFYQVPRNPAPRPVPLPHATPTSMDEMRKRQGVTVVDHSVFEPLERPELFFDYTHLNTEGRKLFSPLLADTVKAALNSTR